MSVHLGKLVIRGTAPDHLAFEFRVPRDRRNVTDDDPVPEHGPLRRSAHVGAGALGHRSLGGSMCIEPYPDEEPCRA